MFGKTKKPGFCPKCGSPQESVEVCDRDLPYDQKTGAIKIIGHRFACTDSECEFHKSRQVWARATEIGLWHLVWVGRVPARPAARS